MCRSDPPLVQYLVLRASLEDLRARIGRPTLAKAAVGLPCNRVEEDRVGEGELALWIPATGVLPVVSSRLSESIVEEASARTAHPVEHSVEDPLPVLVLVEAKLKKVVHESTGLRVAERVHKVQIPGQRVGISFAVHRRAVQKCGDITDGREPQAGDTGILRGIRELVQPALPEWVPEGNSLIVRSLTYSQPVAGIGLAGLCSAHAR